MKLFLAIIMPLALFAQFRSSQIRIIPTTDGTAVGQIEFDTIRSDNKAVVLRAPSTATAGYALTLPQSAPATNGECLTSTTAGALSFAACGGSSNWVASGLNSTHSGGAVVIRNGYGASTLNGAINASQTTITVSDGASFVSGKHIRIDSEVMLVTGISGDTLTVTRGVNFSAAASHSDGATVGTAGFLEIQQSDGVYPFRLGNGMWYAGAVPYFRPTAAGQGILDVSSNGFADAWIDVCGTDVETGIVAFECLELRSNRSEDGGTTYGHVGMKAFGSGTTVRDLAINENGAQVTIGGNTFSNNLRVQASASDAKGITIFGTAAPGLEITNGTEAVYVGLSTAADKYFPDSVAGNLALRSSNGIGFTADAGTTTHLRISGGVSRFRTHLEFGTHNTWGIGTASVRPSVVYSQADNTRKQEFSDLGGGAGFWDARANASTTTSDFTLRDGVGSRALRFTRVFTSSPDNSLEVFGALLPAQRSTGSGDAVNDATAPSIGATGRRWTAGWFGTVTATSEMVAPTFTASADFTGAVNNVTNVGTSSLRMASVWTTGLNASGTITFPTGAAAGRVWTSDGSGNGSWVAPSTSQWVTSGSDIYYSTGKVTVGSATAGTDLINIVGSFPGFGIRNTGAAANERVWRIYSNESDRSLTFLSVNDALSAASVPFEIVRNSGTHTTQFVRIAKDGGATSVGGTLTLGGAVIASATDTHDIGSSTRFRSIYGKTVNAENLEITNGTFVTTFWRHDLNSASTYRISSGSGTQIEMQMGTTSSTQSDVGFRGTLYPLSTAGSNGDLGTTGSPWKTIYLSTGFRLTSGAAAGRVLTSDASGNGTWVTPSTGGTVTSIATTSPISGGTITTTGTISCPTCFTTAGGTLSGGIAASVTDTHDIGSSTRFRNIFGRTGNFENLEIANGTFTGTFWRHSLNSAATYRIQSGSGSQTEVQIGTISSTSSDIGFRGTLYPLSTSGSNGDLGFSATPFRSLFLSSTATIGGAITANGGIATASGTNSTIYVGSGNLYLRTFSGADASCSGVTNGWIGYRTDTNELQVCNGGSVKKVSLL
jgi:hypothetical protein